jgi:hypothetical protein
MPKGKPWTNEEEKQLRGLLKSHKTLKVIASTLRKSENAIRQKMLKLGLKEEKNAETDVFSSSNLVLSKELPSVEEALKILCAALKALQQGGLDQTEIFRLRTVIQGCKIYKELLADYIDYRGIEAKIVEMEEKYERLASQAKGDASKQDNAPVAQAPTK